ncbi:MAG: hypothetical protein K8F91_14490 [Candidatus Obscuribacterales bacterium]|nr:hypothetical protein [Candidatus Obscuribacterales bacterium]
MTRSFKQIGAIMACLFLCEAGFAAENPNEGNAKISPVIKPDAASIASELIRARQNYDASSEKKRAVPGAVLKSTRALKLKSGTLVESKDDGSYSFRLVDGTRYLLPSLKGARKTALQNGQLVYSTVDKSMFYLKPIKGNPAKISIPTGEEMWIILPNSTGHGDLTFLNGEKRLVEPDALDLMSRNKMTIYPVSVK